MSSDFNWDHVAYWEHYKGGRYVLEENWIMNLEEDFGNPDIPRDMVEMVAYRSIDRKGERPWVRRYAYFFGEVEFKGQMVQRFKPVTWREAYAKEQQV